MQPAPTPAPSLVPAPAPAPTESTQIFTLNLGGAQIAAPLTPAQMAALEGTINKTVGSIPGVSSVSVAGVQVIAEHSRLSPGVCLVIFSDSRASLDLSAGSAVPHVAHVIGIG